MAKGDFITVPTWDNGVWTERSFNTRDDFKLFVLLLFKEPGQYEFDETSFLFNQQARLFNERDVKDDGNGWYCDAPFKSKDFLKYWDDEKAKCRNGVIFMKGDQTWYLPRDYYMWINFMKIYNKEVKKFEFASVRDVQYHMALYELLAELHYMHAAVLKKRQIASSYFHCAKIINLLWFEEGAVMKMGASLKDYVNIKGSWKFLNEYRSFLNQHTAWYRPFDPKGEGLWQQQIEEKDGNGRSSLVGLKGTLSMTTFERDPAAGVGGPCTLFFHEEAGIAPKMDTTMEFLIPALQSGDITTGLFVAAGSVGDLDQCEPLKRLIYKPRQNNIYPVTSNLLDDKGTIGETGLFLPEQWSMPPYIDKFGNSDIIAANAALDAQREIWKRDLEPEQFQFRISQRPRNIAEAFAYKTVSVFPPHLVAAQEKRIEDKEYPIEFIDLERDAMGKIIAKKSNRIPIREFPISKNAPDKRGVLEVFERPNPDAEFGTCLASVDPVNAGKTTTSVSLCSIYVYRKPVEVIKKFPDGTIKETYIEAGRIVACWTGRFDDPEDTHRQLAMILEWYKARCIVENNVTAFIQYMMSEKLQKYLVPKNEIIFLKEASSNKSVYQDYGWRNTGRLFHDHLLDYLIKFMMEVTDTITKDDGEIVKRIYGVERIPDIMVIKEMKDYQEGKNVDRLISLSALIAFAKVQQTRMGNSKRVEEEQTDLQKSSKMRTLEHSPFRHMGGNGMSSPGKGKPRSPFKNYR